MSEPKESWETVSSKASSLGVKLKLHFEQARSAAGDGPGGEPAEESKESKEVKDAFRRLADAIDDAFGAVGNVAKDPAVKEDVKGVGQALVDAVGSTFSQVSEEVKRVVSSRKGGKAGDPAPWADGAAPTEASDPEPPAPPASGPPADPA